MLGYLCLNQLSMVLRRLLVCSRLLVLVLVLVAISIVGYYWEVKSYRQILTAREIGAPHPGVIQRSTLYIFYGYVPLENPSNIPHNGK